MQAFGLTLRQLCLLESIDCRCAQGTTGGMIVVCQDRAFSPATRAWANHCEQQCTCRGPGAQPPSARQPPPAPRRPLAPEWPVLRESLYGPSAGAPPGPSVGAPPDTPMSPNVFTSTYAHLMAAGPADRSWFGPGSSNPPSTPPRGRQPFEISTATSTSTSTSSPSLWPWPY